MTREEAKQIISDIDKAYRNYTADEYKALEMAIKALEMQPLIEKFQELDDKEKLARLLAMVQEPCEDAISRQDAIDAIYEHEFSNWCDKDEVSTILNDLPSVTPKYIECEDTISREAVFNAIEREDKWLLAAKGHNGLTEMAFSGLKARIDALLPVTQKSGKWIPVSERLPEEREWYLAVFKEKDTDYQLIPRVADYIGKGENKWRIIDEEGLCQEYRDILECIAWMSLPKPYETQESEE